MTIIPPIINKNATCRTADGLDAFNYKICASVYLIFCRKAEFEPLHEV